MKIIAEGLSKFASDMSSAPRVVRSEMDKNIAELARVIAERARGRANSSTAQLAALSTTIEAKGDTITAGGRRVVSSSGRPAGEWWFGADHGSSRAKQFPTRSTDGRTIFPAIKDADRQIDDAFMDPIMEAWDG